jgi:hypothetical protein
MPDARSEVGAVKTVLILLLALLVLVAAVGGFGYWYYLKRDVPVRYSEAAERYKYQSIGSEVTAMPFYIWKALPAVCPDMLPPEGYAGFGFTYEPGHDRPVGVTLRTVGIPRAGINCATCHSGTFRKSPSDARVVMLGAPSHQLDLERYARFLLGCTTSDNYTPDRVMAAIQQSTHLSALDSAVYRYLIVPGTRSEMIKMRDRLAWMDRRPDFGPGRFDAFNPVKADFKFDMAHDSTLGTADYPSVWNQQAREHMALHWDGSNRSAAERNIAASISAGATPDTVDHEEIDWTATFLRTLPPPKYPFPIDAALAEKGAPLFDLYCSRCHDPAGSQVGKTTEVTAVGTDRLRFDVFTQEFADRLNTIGKGYTWKFKGYQKSAGYANVLLDGLWARAPYLHNGSVRNLRELFEPAEKRTPVFYRGYDVYDPENVGFVTLGPEAERAGFKYDTSLRGNGNGGHLYGVDLTTDEKQALVEYLKGK